MTSLGGSSTSRSLGVSIPDILVRKFLFTLSPTPSLCTPGLGMTRKDGSSPRTTPSFVFRYTSVYVPTRGGSLGTGTHVSLSQEEPP